MSTKNLKPLFFDKVQEFSDKLPEYTIGEMLYSMFTQLSSRGIEVDKKSDLLSIPDEDMYSAMSRAMSNETEE